MEKHRYLLVFVALSTFSSCYCLLWADHQGLLLHPGKKVYVVGAGLGGVAFGLSLLKLCEEHNVRPLPEVHLFERDSSEDAQTGHGYSLGVRSDSGGLQVRRAGAQD